MKRLSFLFAGLLAVALNSVAGDADAPRGSLLELHSCELYAGGCTVSAEVPQDGRYMLRVWNFTGGTFDGADLKGLQLAVLQTSPDNLATADSKTRDAVVYLPEAATPSQRDTLLAWIKSSQNDLKNATLQTRTAPLKFVKGENNYSFSAGEFASIKIASMESCDAISCGETLWYEPRSTTSLYTVMMNLSSQVDEPLLKLAWSDSIKRSVFLARFGEANSSKDVYVTLGELCGTSKSLF